MGFPQVAATNKGSNASGTSHTVNLPTGIKAGDLLVVEFLIGGAATNSTITYPANWVHLLNDLVLDEPRLNIAYKIAVASDEDDVSITVTTSQTVNSAYLTRRITHHKSVDFPPVAASGLQVSANPSPPYVAPNSAPTAESRNYLWLAAAGEAGDITGYPTNYTDGVTTSNGTERVATARRALAAQSENPGTFTGANVGWVAQTVAIAPPPGGATPSVVGVASGSQGSNATAHTISLPSGIQAGDVIIVFWVRPIVDGRDASAGFKNVGQVETGVGLYTKMKVADGNEGTSVVFTTHISMRSVHYTYVVRGARKIITPAFFANASGTSTTPDPPNLQPSVMVNDGQKSYLVIAVIGANGAPTFNTAPSGYTNLDSQAQSTTLKIGDARKEQADDEADPGSFGLSTTPDSVGMTMLIHPLSDVVGVRKFVRHGSVITPKDALKIQSGVHEDDDAD